MATPAFLEVRFPNNPREDHLILTLYNDDNSVVVHPMIGQMIWSYTKDGGGMGSAHVICEDYGVPMKIVRGQEKACA